MKRRTFLATCTAFLALAGQARAGSYSEAIVAQLTQQGFANIAVETTWLGRVRIVASRSDGIREIILNPRTGEILRDLWTTAQGQTAYSLVDPVASPGASATSSSNSPDTSGDTSSDTGQPASDDDSESGTDPGNDPSESESNADSGGEN